MTVQLENNGAEVLRVEAISHRYGGVEALSDVTFSVVRGERLGIIGPNGAGKTTLFSCMTGQPRPTSGRVWFLGDDVTDLPPHARAHLGVARSFQMVSLLNSLSVEENALIAAAGSQDLRYRVIRRLRGIAQVTERADWIMEQAGLTDRRKERVSDLAYGEQRRLDLALTLAGNPSAFLLDEPSAGLSATEREEVVGIIGRMAEDVAVVIIDHDMDVIFSVADRILVLHHGRIVAEGTRDEIKDDPTVRDVYLGGGAAVA